MLQTDIISNTDHKELQSSINAFIEKYNCVWEVKQILYSTACNKDGDIAYSAAIVFDDFK